MVEIMVIKNRTITSSTIFTNGAIVVLFEQTTPKVLIYSSLMTLYQIIFILLTLYK